MKKFAFLFVICIAVLATGCPKSTPKQPLTFKKLNGEQNEIVVKLDTEFAKYECLISGRNWSEVSSPANQQVQRELTRLKSREQQIAEELKTLITERYGNC